MNWYDLVRSIQFVSCQAIRRGEVEVSRWLDVAANAKSDSELNELLCVACDYSESDYTHNAIAQLQFDSMQVRA